MPVAIPGLMASPHLPGSLASCSWQAGWRSLLLRGYAEPAASDMFRTPACRDHLVVLVLEGPCESVASAPQAAQRSYFACSRARKRAAGALSGRSRGTRLP